MIFYGYAALPINYVDSGYMCTPPNGVYDADSTLGTQTITALQTAMNAWGTAADRWERIKLPHGWNLHGSSYVTAPDGTSALLVAPVKVGATKCLVVESDTPLLPDVIPCAHGLPLPGQGSRNPGCANDLPSMWSFTVDSTPTNGFTGIYLPPGSNHILIRDVELTVAKGAFQGTGGVKVVILADFECDHCGIERFYSHGWDPGDAGQPGGAAPGWKMNGTVNTSGQTITWATGKRFGMSFSDGTHSPGYPQATITIGGDASGNCVGGTNYLISQHDPGASDTVLTTNNSAGTQTGANYCMTNPATAYANGSGDDQRGIQMNCDWCWANYGYSEKNHWTNSESHAISYGFSKGPNKFTHLWLEAGSVGLFSGGAPVDTRGGPVSDLEVWGNYFGRDLNWRFLSAASGKSPHPPFGAGPLDNNSSHDNAIFNWAMKNDLELKLGHRVWIGGNIIENSWADGQSGYGFLTTVRSCSGGTTCGVFDPITNLPMTVIDNVRFENNWVRNTPQILQLSTRALGAGNGGGLSTPITNLDYINNLFSNVGDDAQFGAPGPDIAQWAASGQTFLATMTRTSNIAHAVVQPIKLLNNSIGASAGTLADAFDVSTVSRSGTTVTMKLNGNRHDPWISHSLIVRVQDWQANTNYSGTQIKPTVGNAAGTIFSTGSNASSIKTGATPPTWSTCTTTCSDNGITWTNTGTTSVGFEGSFTISDVQINATTTPRCTTDNSGATVTTGGPASTQPQPCVRNDGTFGDTIIYTQSGAAWTSPICSTLSACNALGLQAIMDTLAYKVTDIQLGDPVYVHNCTGGVNPTLYQVGSAASVLTSAGTSPTGLDVFYPNGPSNPDDGTSAVTCQLENSSGLPANTTFVKNTVLSPDIMSIGSNGVAGQHYNNRFISNIFAMPAGNNAVLTDSDVGGQGTAVFAAWDPGTFQWFDNVMPLRTSSQWSEVPAGSATHCTPGIDCFPPSISCSASTVAGSSARCMGFAGFMSGNAYPGPCATPPFNCRMMALPWASNFSLADVTPVADSPYKLQGADVTALAAAFTSIRRTCPLGAYCGISGPQPDFAHYAAISWTSSVNQGSGGCCTYNIYRSTTPGVFGSALVTGLSGNSYVDRNLSQATTYYYTVRSFDGVNESPNSGPITGIVP